MLKEVADHDRASGSLLSLERLRTHLFTSKGVVKAVDGVSFDIKPREIMGLVGESGSGKTMTGLSIMQLLPSPPAKIVDGRIMFNGKDLTKIPDDEIRKIRGSKISMVFQDPLTSLNPLIRVGRQVSEVIQIHSSLPKELALSKAIEILEQVGIPEARTVASQYPFELSGGMRQRVMIAVAVASRPELLIADEPTTNLDTTIQAQVLSLLSGLDLRPGGRSLRRKTCRNRTDERRPEKPEPSVYPGTAQVRATDRFRAWKARDDCRGGSEIDAPADQRMPLSSEMPICEVCL